MGGSRYGWNSYGYGWRDPFFDPRWGIYYGRPYWSSWGRNPFYYGWNDPFWYASPYAGYGSYGYDRVREYTVYKSFLDMVAEPGYYIPEIDWRRTARRVLTMEWLDGIKLNERDALIEAKQDCKALAATLVRAFLRQAVVDGFFHADLHHGNLFALADGRIAAIDFGIMGRIDRRARVWLAEILYGLITGDYRRVAEIHFEAQYVPSHHNVEEFATALRAAGEPIRGLPVKEISVGRMLESLFSITRDFDMPVEQLLGVVSADPLENGFGLDMPVQPVRELHRQIGFRITNVALAEERLAMQIGQLDHIIVDDRELADACSSQ